MHKGGRMRSLAVIFFVGTLLFAPTGAKGQSNNQTPSVDPSDAVFQIEVLDRQPGSDGHMHGHGYGTAFFISGDGTAITASHVVYRPFHDPEKYRLIAIVGKEFYDANVICASKLPYDPTQPDSNKVGVPYSRDVAEIKLAPSTMPKGHRRFFFKAKSGEEITIATAHTDTLPIFPFLTIGGHPDHQVRVLGFGGISPLPYKWASAGHVVRTWSSSHDGTPLFDIQSPNPAVPGDSGAPVLNDHNEVVGLWAWHYYNKPDTGTAQGSTVLKAICN